MKCWKKLREYISTFRNYLITNMKFMKSTLSIAKRETYLENLKTGNIKSKTMRILYMIQQRPFTNTDEVRSLLSISHQTATAILSNLLDLGIIKIAGETKINDNTYSRYLFVSEYQEQYNLSKQRKKEKFALWIKQGLNSYADLLNARLHFELVIADENE